MQARQLIDYVPLADPYKNALPSVLGPDCDYDRLRALIETPIRRRSRASAILRTESGIEPARLMEPCTLWRNV
jgi:hypothetical protein